MCTVQDGIERYSVCPLNRNDPKLFLVNIQVFLGPREHGNFLKAGFRKSES